MTFKISPGEYLFERDRTANIRAPDTRIGATVFACNYGPMELTQVTSINQLLKDYGKADPSVSYGIDCVMEYLEYAGEGASCWVKRVVNNAQYAGLSYYNDSEIGEETSEDSSTSPRTLTRSYPWTANMATVKNYLDGNRNILTLKLVDNFSSGDDIEIEFNGGQFTATYTVASSIITTEMAGLTTAINNAITLAGGTNHVVTQINDTIGRGRVITIICPSSMNDLLITDVKIESGELIYSNSSRLFDIYAQNPGSWASNNIEGIGVKISKLDPGIQQRITLTFSSSLIIDNTFAVTINGTTINPVVFLTNSDNTMGLIAAEIALHPDVASASVVQMAASSSNDRQILIIAKNPGPDKLEVTNPTVTFGASQATVVAAETTIGIDSDNTFNVDVFVRGNTTIPIESYKVTIGDFVNGFNDQQNIAEKINNNSSMIRIYQSNEMKSAALMARLIGNDLNVDSNIQWLTQGTNGAAVTAANIKAGWDEFANPEKIEIRNLFSSGYTAVDILQYIHNIAFNRKDCFAFLDTPSNSQSLSGLVNFRNHDLNIDSSRASIIAPDYKIVDRFTGIRRFIPPSGYHAGVAAFTDKNFGIHFAPAGFDASTMRNTIELRHEYNESARDVLSPTGVNCIIRKNNTFVLWDERTLQRKVSALQSIPVRRNITSDEIAIMRLQQYMVFKPANAETYLSMQEPAQKYFNQRVSAGAYYRAIVICNEDVNTDADRDAGVINMIIRIQPTITGRFINIEFNIDPTGATFTEG